MSWLKVILYIYGVWWFLWVRNLKRVWLGASALGISFVIAGRDWLELSEQGWRMLKKLHVDQAHLFMGFIDPHHMGQIHGIFQCKLVQASLHHGDSGQSDINRAAKSDKNENSNKSRASVLAFWELALAVTQHHNHPTIILPPVSRGGNIDLSPIAMSTLPSTSTRVKPWAAAAADLQHCL